MGSGRALLRALAVAFVATVVLALGIARPALAGGAPGASIPAVVPSAAPSLPPDPCLNGATQLCNPTPAPTNGTISLGKEQPNPSLLTWLNKIFDTSSWQGTATSLALGIGSGTIVVMFGWALLLAFAKGDTSPQVVYMQLLSTIVQSMPMLLFISQYGALSQFAMTSACNLAMDFGASDVGAGGSAGFCSTLMPGKVLGYGFKIVHTILSIHVKVGHGIWIPFVGTTNILANLIIFVAVVIILGGFGWAALEILVIGLEATIVTGIAPLFLGFVFFPPLSHLADGAKKYLPNIAVRIFFVLLPLSLGIGILTKGIRFIAHESQTQNTVPLPDLLGFLLQVCFFVFLLTKMKKISQTIMTGQSSMSVMDDLVKPAAELAALGGAAALTAAVGGSAILGAMKGGGGSDTGPGGFADPGGGLASLAGGLGGGGGEEQGGGFLPLGGGDDGGNEGGMLALPSGMLALPGGGDSGGAGPTPGGTGGGKPGGSRGTNGTGAGDPTSARSSVGGALGALAGAGNAGTPRLGTKGSGTQPGGDPKAVARGGTDGASADGSGPLGVGEALAAEGAALTGNMAGAAAGAPNDAIDAAFSEIDDGGASANDGRASANGGGLVRGGGSASGGSGGGGLVRGGGSASGGGTPEINVGTARPVGGGGQSGAPPRSSGGSQSGAPPRSSGGSPSGAPPRISRAGAAGANLGKVAGAVGNLAGLFFETHARFSPLAAKHYGTVRDVAHTGGFIASELAHVTRPTENGGIDGHRARLQNHLVFQQQQRMNWRGKVSGYDPSLIQAQYAQARLQQMQADAANQPHSHDPYGGTD